MQNKAEILLKLNALAECFDRELSKTAQRLYLNCLDDFTDEQATHALNRAGRECKFFPKPAELIEFIEGPKPSAKDHAAIAWDTLINAIEKYGAYRSVQFEDQTIMAVVRSMGGWRNVCMWETDDLNWRMKEFTELYSGLSGGLNGPQYLPGVFEQGNLAAGYQTEEPIYIGAPNSKQITAGKQSNDVAILSEINRRLKKSEAAA